MRYKFISTNTVSVRKMKITSDEHTEKLNSSSTAGGNVNWCSHYRK